MDWFVNYGIFWVFLVAFLSGTVLALPTEAVMVTLIYAAPHLAWMACAAATVGGALGGVVTWWMGYGARKIVRKDAPSAWELRTQGWLKRWGARACIMTWVPLLGDIICAAAGWLKLPFWPCLIYMTLGKGLRYAVVVLLALQIF